MAFEEVKYFGSRKRKRGSKKRKLLVNERVEVRSLEDGFLGSWHPGTVIHCGKQKRHVRYDNILDDDESNFLVDVVGVSVVLDGLSSSICNTRGLIRPLPPIVEFGRWDLPFSLCVDVRYQEAWWEGVIFDYCDGMEERSIFFPDLGDEMKVGIHQLRITQDWDEATENWVRRGNWVFLELVEECEQASFVPVSVKQIWYDVRARKDFDIIRDWTSNVKDSWRDLVMEVINDYYTLTLNEVFPFLNLPGCFLQETPELDFVEPIANVDLNKEVDMADILAVVNSGNQLSRNADVYCGSSTNNSFGSDIGTADSPLEKGDSLKLLDTDQNCGSILPIQEKYDMDYLVDGASHRQMMVDVFPTIVTPPLSVKVVDEPEFCPQAVVQYCLHALEKHRAEKKEWKLKAKKHLLAEGWILDYPTKKGRGVLYNSPQNQRVFSLLGACRLYIKENIAKWTISGMRPLKISVHNEESFDQVDSDDLLQTLSQLLQKEPELHNIDGVPVRMSTGNRKRKWSRNSKTIPPKCQRNGSPIQVLRSSKRVQKVLGPCLSHQKPQNVLSWLIDSNIVLPRSKVYCWAKGRELPMTEGRITRDGIKCSCCQKVYSRGGFVQHASGSSNCRPAASIFLKDGRSLLDCQIQIMHDQRARETMEKPCNDLCQGENDSICSVCHYGGELILCDQCPSSFHKMCLGLEDIPDGDWFCPSCCCRICGRIKIKGAEDGHFLTCIQCERKYHVRCLRNRAIDKSRRYGENWLCGKECEKIYAGLHKLLGEPVAVDANNLTWTLVKCVSPESCDLGSTNDDFLAESYSRLNVALSVMHECFEPLKEPSSSRDLMEDVIFSRWSELNRSNCQGFYTVLLERNEELISVATVRIYGEKVAEVPLVGTRFQYRRLGMCRILMNELEKKLMQLGVERLVLPAVPGVLETWTGSFGFAKMTNFERSQFLDYTFLDFQDTVLCQKLLKISSPNSASSRETLPKPRDVFSLRCKIDFDESSPVSEVYQAEENDKSEMLDPQMVYMTGNDHLGSDAIDPVTTVKQPTLEGQQCQNGTSPKCYLVKQVDRHNRLFKCYNRRKFSKLIAEN